MTHPLFSIVGTYIVLVPKLCYIFIIKIIFESKKKIKNLSNLFIANFFWNNQKTLHNQKCDNWNLVTKNVVIERWQLKIGDWKHGNQNVWQFNSCGDSNLWQPNSYGDWKHVATEMCGDQIPMVIKILMIKRLFNHHVQGLWQPKWV